MTSIINETKVCRTRLQHSCVRKETKKKPIHASVLIKIFDRNSYILFFFCLAYVMSGGFFFDHSSAACALFPMTNSIKEQKRKKKVYLLTTEKTGYKTDFYSFDVILYS